MLRSTWWLLAFALVAVSGLGAHGTGATRAPSTQGADQRALDGEWLYVEDRTDGRPIEQHQPSMSGTFGLRVEKDAVVVLRGKGSERREIRVALDGSTTEVSEGKTVTRYSGSWKDGAFAYETNIVRVFDQTTIGLFRTTMRRLDEGLLVRVVVDPPASLDSTALYRHPQDIALPEPAKAAIGDLAWLAGAWVGARGASSLEERWSPPLGGAMLGVSRTVARGKMVAFEYLRVVERGAGLVYVAQPGGTPPTEFVLTEISAAKAVFENPRHDFPQRIVYELSAEGGLTASIGHAKGGKPQRFEFEREDS